MLCRSGCAFMAASRRGNSSGFRYRRRACSGFRSMALAGLSARSCQRTARLNILLSIAVTRFAAYTAAVRPLPLARDITVQPVDIGERDVGDLHGAERRQDMDPQVRCVGLAGARTQPWQVFGRKPVRPIPRPWEPLSGPPRRRADRHHDRSPGATDGPPRAPRPVSKRRTSADGEPALASAGIDVIEDEGSRARGCDAATEALHHVIIV